MKEFAKGFHVNSRVLASSGPRHLLGVVLRVWMKIAFSNPASVILLIYVWWLITTPYHSARFQFLAEINFEKWLAGFFVVMAGVSGRLENLFRPVSILVVLLFLWMLLSYAFSDYQDTEMAVLWKDTYWKKLVFFACLTVTVRSKADLKFVVVGVASIVFFYQLHTWVDFLNGGSFVYQQGMKRMAAVWSGPGYGAGNAWGYLGLFGLPFAMACLRLMNRRELKSLFLVFLISSFMCIVMSGTRGALISAAIYLGFVFRRSLLRFRYAFLIVLAMAVAFPMLPEPVQNRFLSLVATRDSAELSGAEKIAADSARGRLQGLLDGFTLANHSPVLGCGPSASAQAAYDLRVASGAEKEQDQPIQLHNLYGQVVGELGYPGLLIWFALVGTSMIGLLGFLKKTHQDDEGRQALRIVCRSLIGLLAVMSIYGFGGHSLYDFHWLLVFGLANSFLTIAPQYRANEQGIERN